MHWCSNNPPSVGVYTGRTYIFITYTLNLGLDCRFRSGKRAGPLLERGSREQGGAVSEHRGSTGERKGYIFIYGWSLLSTVSQGFGAALGFDRGYLDWEPLSMVVWLQGGLMFRYLVQSLNALE